MNQVETEIRRLRGSLRDEFYERVFRAAARLYPALLRGSIPLEPGFEDEEDEAYKRCAREAIRAAEFLVLELQQAWNRCAPGRPR